MKILKTGSIALKIWLIFTFMIVVIICSISLLYLFSFKNFSENMSAKNMKRYHEIILSQNNFKAPIDFNKLKDLINIENFVVIFNGNSKNIYYVNNSANQLMPPKNTPGFKKLNWVSNFAKSVTSETEFRKYYNGTKFFIVASPIKLQSTGKSYLVTYMPYTPNNKFLYETIIVGIIFILIALFTSKIISLYISKPLNKLEIHTTKIANKNWDNPINIDTNDEIGRLAKSMNIMQEKLKYADENEKLFLQSISHDLKTPVTVIMSYAEAIMDGLYIKSLNHTAEIIQSEAINLRNKINEILYLNTLEYSLKNNLVNKNIDLKDILNNIVDRLTVVNQNIRWDVKIKSAIINADKEKITVSIENIVDNALRYAKDLIKINLKIEDSFIIVEIYNNGKNIKDENIKLIFDNMYKDRTGNFGLGLYISKKITDCYNGSIEAVNRNPGVSFIIKYPLNNLIQKK
ncbi:HAMP domain-containing sensor histidine kinase [Clostridium tyrobutyricum]|uniref:HAMP domain-containing sensor histidine kinase n=1 Tax=Clostridium tyrobutyricum TaxID=1519 RepID=UPI0030D1A48E